MSVPGQWRVDFYTFGLAPNWETEYFSTEQEALHFFEIRKSAWGFINDTTLVKDPEFITVFDIIRDTK